MAEFVQIHCARKPERADPHEHITHVGGIHAGLFWRLTEEEAIAGIDAGRWQFYVTTGGRTVKVIVERSPDGQRFLKTEADPNNLLSLPECPP
jgi:hypothetical protein